ncbi:hypothetical protein LZ190_25835, partial [Rhodovulum sulfidophilum]|nr:hypothetical protein [Rhodovulum sulfidophilum]
SLSKMAAVLALGSLKRLQKRIDPRRVNGGVFLGLNGTVVKSHGSADGTGVAAAIALAARLLPTVPQLIGEELLGILPFLAVLWFCVTRMRLSRPAGILIGLLVSAPVFGAAHLPTYDWNWGQALLGIGSARVFLTLAYV